jgi:hypothetical protein
MHSANGKWDKPAGLPISSISKKVLGMLILEKEL